MPQVKVLLPHVEEGCRVMASLLDSSKHSAEPLDEFIMPIHSVAIRSLLDEGYDFLPLFFVLDRKLLLPGMVTGFARPESKPSLQEVAGAPMLLGLALL